MPDAEPSLLLIYASLGLSALLLLLMYRRSRGQSPLFYLAAFFAFFAFGPVVNHVLGNPIYFGIVVEHLDTVSLGFVMAIGGLATAEVTAGRRKATAPLATKPTSARYAVLPLVLVGLTTYGFVTAVRILPVALGEDKLGQVAAAGTLHSPYLVLEIGAVSTYFIAARTPLFLGLWRANLVAYVVYCLLTSERDFLFVLFSVLLHSQLQGRLQGRRKRSTRVVVAGIGLVLVASLLFASRGGERFDFAGVLNQGSIAFVDSFIQERVPTTISYRHGGTYADAVASLPLLPGTGQNLSSWLVTLYAPGSPGGYGFSLSGEAYLNFGYPGIFVVFLGLGRLVRWANDRFGSTDFGTYLSVYVTAVVMYAFRIDSAQLLRSVLYGTIFFVLIGLLDGRDRRSRTRLPGRERVRWVPPASRPAPHLG